MNVNEENMTGNYGSKLSSKLELRPVNFEFKKMAQNVVDIVRFAANEKDQKLSVNIDDNIPSILIGDEIRIVQILVNLLSNAIKFTPEGGRIELNVELLAEIAGSCGLRFSVKDSGIGISDEEKERLFDSFEQAETDTPRNFSGTGLGLSISKKIVEMMDGKIRVKSELGQGAEFSFALVFEIGSERDTKAGLSDVNKYSRSVFPGHNILLVDDSKTNRHVVTGLLKDTKINIDCAVNGVEALKIFTDNPDKYDMILMDIRMPEMDGHEATRHIRKMDIPQAKKIPIVAMTANVLREDVEQCFDSGMNDHIGKPVDPDKLLGLLRKHISTGP